MHPSLTDLLVEYDRALDHTAELVGDLSTHEIDWRPHEQSSAIGWHLGHQAAVAHYLVRNLTSAEPSIDPGLDALFDSATPEVDRGVLPDPASLFDYRGAVADRVRAIIERIDRGEVGAPAQLRLIATGMFTSIVNHEYQHSQWIGEVRAELGKALPPRPTSPLLSEIDGYLVVGASAPAAGFRPASDPLRLGPAGP